MNMDESMDKQVGLDTQNQKTELDDVTSDLSNVCLLDDPQDDNLTSAELDKQLKFENLFRTNLSDHLIEEYRRYANEQYPNDPQSEKETLEQMQDEYFHHYMNNVQRPMMDHQKDQLIFLKDSMDFNNDNGDKEIPEIKIFPLIPARMWLKPDINTFKKEILNTSKNCCIKISSLAVATISVPTHVNGSSVWWEFATDNYDLAFGLFFEWGTNPSDQILVTINDSDDEGDEFDDDEEILNDSDDSEGNRTRSSVLNSERSSDDPEVALKNDNDDPEFGNKNKRRKNSTLPTDELIPVIRRNCHQQVYCGQHLYPGQGRYLFKFDNSFSIIRSKWLYYRVYYSKD